MHFNHQSGHDVDVDGARIYVEVKGRDDAPPVVLLHGGVGTIEDFNSLLPRLAAHYRVIGIDSRGHGRSTMGNVALTYQQLQRDVTHVLGHLNVVNPAVIGFSDGGVVGYRLMASDKSTCPRLVAIGAPCELSPDDPVRDIYAKVTGASWRTKFPDSYELYQRLNPEPNFERLLAASVKMWMDTTPSGYPADRIDTLQGEVLVVRGDTDHLFPLKDAVELATRLQHCAFANVAFAGHVAHQDQPEAVLLGIERFLRFGCGAA